MNRPLIPTLIVAAACVAPAMAFEPYACTGGMQLTSRQGAVVVAGSRGKSALIASEPVFTGDALVYTPDGVARSCEGQSVCVIGICDDSYCTFDVSVGGG